MNNYYQQKGLIITRNIHVKYKNPGTHCSKAISQVKSSQKFSKRQGNSDKNVDMHEKILSLGIHV